MLSRSCSPISRVDNTILEYGRLGHETRSRRDVERRCRKRLVERNGIAIRSELASCRRIRSHHLVGVVRRKRVVSNKRGDIAIDRSEVQARRRRTRVGHDCRIALDHARQRDRVVLMMHELVRNRGLAVRNGRIETDVTHKAACFIRAGNSAVVLAVADRNSRTILRNHGDTASLVGLERGQVHVVRAAVDRRAAREVADDAAEALRAGDRTRDCCQVTECRVLGHTNERCATLVGILRRVGRKERTKITDLEVLNRSTIGGVEETAVVKTANHLEARDRVILTIECTAEGASIELSRGVFVLAVLDADARPCRVESNVSRQLERLARGLKTSGNTLLEEDELRQVVDLVRTVNGGAEVLRPAEGRPCRVNRGVGIGNRHVIALLRAIGICDDERDIRAASDVGNHERRSFAANVNGRVLVNLIQHRRLVRVPRKRDGEHSAAALSKDVVPVFLNKHLAAASVGIKVLLGISFRIESAAIDLAAGSIKHNNHAFIVASINLRSVRDIAIDSASAVDIEVSCRVNDARNSRDVAKALTVKVECYVKSSIGKVKLIIGRGVEELENGTGTLRHVSNGIGNRIITNAIEAHSGGMRDNRFRDARSGEGEVRAGNAALVLSIGHASDGNFHRIRRAPDENKVRMARFEGGCILRNARNGKARDFARRPRNRDNLRVLREQRSLFREHDVVKLALAVKSGRGKRHSIAALDKRREDGIRSNPLLVDGIQLARLNTRVVMSIIPSAGGSVELHDKAGHGLYAAVQIADRLDGEAMPRIYIADRVALVRLAADGQFAVDTREPARTDIEIRRGFVLGGLNPNGNLRFTIREFRGDRGNVSRILVEGRELDGRVEVETVVYVLRSRRLDFARKRIAEGRLDNQMLIIRRSAGPQRCEHVRQMLHLSLGVRDHSELQHAVGRPKASVPRLIERVVVGRSYVKGSIGGLIETRACVIVGVEAYGHRRRRQQCH